MNRRTEDHVALLLLNLDRFEDINDTLGHRAGDDLLKHQPSQPHINRPTRNRAVAARYDKLAVRYEATIHVVAISEWFQPDM